MFLNRVDAAEKLLPKLKRFAGKEDTLLLAIPRGSLEMGAVLKRALHLPLDIVITKKIGAPYNEEYAIGAVDQEGNVLLNEEAVLSLGIPESYIEREREKLKELIRKRLIAYRGKAPPLSIEDKTVILIDDGVATGLTTLAAVRYLRSKNPKRVILAVPVGAPDSLEKLEEEVDELISLERPDDFYAVGAFYYDFPQVSDEEAISLLGMRDEKESL